MKRASENLLNKIIEFEGMKLRSYKCPAGVWTIGVGHTAGVKSGQTISKLQAISLLKGDLLPCEKEVNKLSDLTQGQFDSLVDFCFNLGIGAFQNSTLRKKIVAKASKEEIQCEFMKFVNAGGKKLPGLVKRRLWEANNYD